MNINFIIPGLQGGGAERVAVTLANALAGRGHAISFIVYSDGESDYALDGDIDIHPVFDEEEISSRPVNRIWRKGAYSLRLNNILNKLGADAVVSFMKGTNGKVLPVSYLKGIPHIATEHTTYKAGINDLWTQFERRYLYRLASAVTVLIEKERTDFYSKYLNNVEVMPNPLPFDIHSNSDYDKKEKIILSAGEMHRWKRKGFDKLIRFFSMIHEDFPEWRLQFAGKGEEGQQKLKEIAHSCGVGHKVDFLGFVENMAHLYRKASIFALYSKNEGFGMVLIEAMSQGCVCISLDSGFGPSQIIEDGRNGFLVPDGNRELFADRLTELIINNDRRKNMADRAREKVKQYSLDNISDRWEELLGRVTNGSTG